MGRYGNKYIPNIIKQSRTDRNHIGWKLRTTNNEGEILYRNDDYVFIYNDNTEVILSQLVALDESNKLPAVDGSQLINLPSSEGVIQGTDSNTLNLRAKDEGSVSGNARGESSVDFQMHKYNADEVASGDYSVILGGSQNKAQSSASTVIGGISNEIKDTSVNAAILGGTGHAVSLASDSSCILGGSSSGIRSSTYSAIVGGVINFIIDSSDYSGIFAGAQNTIEDNIGIHTNSVILGGRTNQIDGNSSHSAIAGGESNIIRGTTHCFIGAGSYNTASGLYSFVTGEGNISSGGRAHTVVGCFGTNFSNPQDTYSVLFSVGNGDNDSTRSTAFRVDKDGSTYLYSIKSGATQVAAGAATGELWYTSSHATLPDGVVMVGL